MKYIKISIIILLFVLLPIQSSVVDVKINICFIIIGKR